MNCAPKVRWSFVSAFPPGEYSEERGKLTTYLYPFLRGKMYRYLEANIGAAALLPRTKCSV